MALVDALHARGIGVILDWVPVSYTHLDVYKRQGKRNGKYK